jgi:PAS domain S-box-containing protein
MSRHHHDRVLPPFLIRMMEVLEKLSASTPLRRSVITITAVGVMLTALVSAWVWHAHAKHDEHEFEVVVQLLQERINAGTAGNYSNGHVLHGWQIQLVEAPDVQALDDAVTDWANAWAHTYKARLRVAQQSGQTVDQIVSGVRKVQGMPAWLDHYGALTVVIAGGGLLTIAGLYAYILIISTRMRANKMAKETTQAITRSESRSRAVVDTAPDAILTVSDDGLVVWCNQATLSIFGQSLEELTGQSLGVVIPDLMGVSLAHWFENHGISGRIIGFETHGCRVEGTRFPIAVSARRAELDGENINTIIVRDTTDAKWAEKELLLRERALASSAEGIIITDMNLPGQPTIFVNEAFEKITGYGINDIIGQNCRILQRDDLDQPGIRAMRQAIALGQACQVVVRNYRKDGSLFWNELNISPVSSVDNRVTHYVGVASDITERMAAEHVLHQRTERLNAVFDLSPDGFVVLDAEGGVSIVNPAFERMTGMSAAALVGQTREALESCLKDLCDSIEIEEAPSPSSSARAAKDESAAQTGSRELLHLKAPMNRTLMRRVRHDEGQSETVMYFRDITQELMIDRMKSEFLSMAAHELRTPMASIYGFTELLLSRKFDDTRRTDMLGTIHRQAHILINLINELLDLARIEARRGKDFKRRHQALQPVIERTVAALLVHGDDRKVAVSLPSEPIELDVDDEKLSQAITNVLSNAYKYSPKGGEIALDVIKRDQEGRGEWGIRVVDCGLGMSAEHQARLFERFFRADTSGNIPGTGLGMTIVKEIIELHGGSVQVESELGRGTTVVLWVPVAGVAAVAA